MKLNVGTPDRIFRVVLGLALLSLFFFVEGPWRWAGLLGIVSLATAAFGFCPIYAVLGMSTCPAAKQA